MKLGEHKVKIKACRRSIKRALSNDLKLVLFKTAREHGKGNWFYFIEIKFNI